MADSFTPEQSSPTVKSFVANNHRLFTVLGVFAALSVYLSQLVGSESSEAKVGVASSLLMFLLLACVGVIKTYWAIERCKADGQISSYARIFPFAIFLYALVSLSASVILIINSEYPEGAGNVLGSALIFALIFVYWSYVTTELVYEELPGYSRVSSIYEYAPHISVVFLGVWMWFSRENLQFNRILQGQDISYTIGWVTGALIIHIFLTLILIISLVVFDQYVIKQAADE